MREALGTARRTPWARLTALVAALVLLLVAPAAAGAGKQELRDATIGVSGMFCSSCASAVEKALKKVDGVVDARVDLKTDQVRVRYDGRRVTLRQMAEAIRQAGYQARLPAAQAR